jgi:hypothetical protein
LIVEGHRSAGDECRDDIEIISDLPVDCGVELEIGPRLLAPEEREYVQTQLARIQIDTIADPRCDDITVDVCSIETVRIDDMYLSDDLCSAPRLLYDQVKRLTNVIVHLAGN